MDQKQANQVKDLAKPCNDVLEKLGWKWEPKLGEWVIEKKPNQTVSYGDKKQKSIPHMVTGMAYYEHDNTLFVITSASRVSVDQSNAIPILPWEEIERVLEGMGWKVELLYNQVKSSKDRFVFIIGAKDGEGFYHGEAKIRQKAVMQAVIKLDEQRRM